MELSGRDSQAQSNKRSIDYEHAKGYFDLVYDPVFPVRRIEPIHPRHHFLPPPDCFIRAGSGHIPVHRQVGTNTAGIERRNNVERPPCGGRSHFAQDEFIQIPSNQKGLLAIVYNT